MKRLVLAALAAVVAVGGPVVTRARSADSRHYVLKFVKAVGPGWASDKYGWMSFVAFSADGKQIASDGPYTPSDVSGDLTIWSFPGGRLVKKLPGRPDAISGNWKYYAASDGVRRLANGEPTISLAKGVFAAFALSPDGTLAAESQYRAGAPIQLFDTASGRQVATFGTHRADSLAISPDGRTLAAGYWDFVALWDIRSAKRVATLRGFGRYVGSLSFRRDGRVLVAGTDEGSVQAWDLRRRKRLFSIDLEGADPSMAFSPNGKLLAAGTYGTGTVWLMDARSGTLLDRKKVSDMGCGSVAFSPDGRYLIAPSTGGLITWPYDRGGTIRVFKVLSRK